MATEEGTRPQPHADDNKDQAKGTGAKASPKKAASGKTSKAAASGEGHVGRVLQNVYQQTIDEDIPAEMLDLLNKLN